MKRLYKILFVFAMTLISYGAFAQTQTVKVGSVRKYILSELNKDKSSYEWHVEKFNGTDWNDAVLGTDYELWKDYFIKDGATAIGSFVDGQYQIFVKWKLAGTNYRVRVTERDAITHCFDSNNVKEQLVEVVENDFTVTVSWDGKTTSAGESCANDGTNIITYTIGKVLGKAGDVWKFKYEVRDGEPGDVDTKAWVEGSTDVNGEGFVDVDASKTEYKLNLSYTIPKGSGDYKIQIRISEARDGYNTLAKDSPQTEATIHKIPDTAVGGIKLD